MRLLRDRCQCTGVHPTSRSTCRVDGRRFASTITRPPETFRRTFSLVPEYLTTPESGSVVDLMDYGVQLGRRFRALKLWWVMRAFGLEGIQERIRHHVELAHGFADWIDGDHSFERMAPVPFSVICFRARPEGLDVDELDAFNLRLLERVNASGEVFLSHPRLDDGIALRVAIGNLGTTSEDIRRCRELLAESSEALTQDL